ncbi:hypothetical protein Ahy_B03g066524 [Arachis hypogaea]|uniref:Protein FAR1-RELATED SEQUENCE n=1 Tax=Arachis hypogaea TaxID=3818 RepID=A0A445A4A0_ARAHY|nr:hypothetical protein Ahy_B03g066524 [Arachis hypogaea]
MLQIFIPSYLHVYTHEKFREVQAQFRGKVNCITRSTQSTLGYTVYEVVEQVQTQHSTSLQLHTTRYPFKLNANTYYSSQEGYFDVTLCALSPRYILERWSKNVKRRYTHIKSSHDKSLLEPKSRRFDDLVFRSQNICEFALEYKELTGILHRAYDNAMLRCKNTKPKEKENVHYLTTMLCWKILTSFKTLQGLRLNTEKQIVNATKKKKKKKKALSELNLFYVGSVVKSNSSHYHGHIMNYQFRDSGE